MRSLFSASRLFCFPVSSLLKENFVIIVSAGGSSASEFSLLAQAAHPCSGAGLPSLLSELLSDSSQIIPMSGFSVPNFPFKMLGTYFIHTHVFLLSRYLGGILIVYP